MELKKVNSPAIRNYAKKEEVSKKDLKKATPHKWIVAASTGIITLFYASPKRSIYHIGVIFGCIEIAKEYNYTPLFHTLNSIMDVFYYATLVFVFGFFISLILKLFNNNSDENKKKKIDNALKSFLIIGLVFLVLTIVLVFILKQDIPAFFEGGIKQDISVFSPNTIMNSNI